MQTDDQYLDRTPDLVAKLRAMRQVADREMDRFTCVADYDVRRVVGRGRKESPVSDKTVLPSPAVERPKRSAVKFTAAQTSIEFVPAPVEYGADGEDA